MCKSCIAKLSGKMAKKRKTKTTYRRRRRARVGAITGSDVMTVVKAGAVAAGGFIAGKMLISKVDFLQTNPGIAAAAQLAGAVVAPMLLKNAVGAGLGMGMAVGALTDVVKMAAPELSATTLGLGFPGSSYPASTRVPGIAGTQAVVTVD